jgi:hypothetical protein
MYTYIKSYIISYIYIYVYILVHKYGGFPKMMVPQKMQSVMTETRETYGELFHFCLGFPIGDIVGIWDIVDISLGFVHLFPW